MARIRRYKATGFLPLVIHTESKIYPVGATINIAKGDAIHSASGYTTNAVTALTNAFLGIAEYDANNSAGLDGAINIHVIPPDPQNIFAVAVGDNALITQAAVGTIVDLQLATTIDINDTTIASGLGFKIEEIDVSTTAVAINTYGFAIGRFVYA